MKLTYTQIRVLHFLREFHALNGYMPSAADITQHFQWASPNSASEHLGALVRRGAITKMPNTARSLRFTPEGAALVGAASLDSAPVMVRLPVLEYRQVAGFGRASLAPQQYASPASPAPNNAPRL